MISSPWDKQPAGLGCGREPSWDGSLQEETVSVLCAHCWVSLLLACPSVPCSPCLCLARASPLGPTKEGRLCWPSSQGSQGAVPSRAWGQAQ